jgi:hypothetical protein
VTILERFLPLLAGEEVVDSARLHSYAEWHARCIGVVGQLPVRRLRMQGEMTGEVGKANENSKVVYDFCSYFHDWLQL